MSTSHTTQAFVHHGDWSVESRKHPALAWFEPVVRDIFDAHLWDTPYSDIYTDDLVLLKPDGTTIQGGKEAWAEVAKLFGPFTKQRTQPRFLVVTDTETGYDTIGTAWIYGNLPGNPSPHEGPKVKDIDGNEWDHGMSGGFHFKYVPGGKGGMLLSLVEIAVDSAPVVMKLLGRGVMKPEDLGIA